MYVDPRVMDVNNPPPSHSQISTTSHITLDPIPATTIAYNEIQRRDANVNLGLCKIGCPEIDDYVLQGGLERGSVVGVSAEKEEFGVTLAMQMLAQGIKDDALSRALIITPRPNIEILQPLRSALNACSSDLKCSLERVELSQVFDIDGVWEVLADLDRAPPSSPEVKPGYVPSLKPEASRVIEDSQDDDDALSPVKEDTPLNQDGSSGNRNKQPPDLIIITHFSTLLTSLFTARPSSTAHPLLTHLSTHIRHLTRTLPSSPLILLLNSTAPEPSPSTSNKPLDPTLRSVFNPPIIPGLPSTGARRNKPSFGMVFSQILDVHLLCTRLPKKGEDADEVFAGGSGEYATAVEVLLDELGVWKEGGGKRRFREQRWGPVDVKEGRIVDAFEKGGKRTYGSVRLAAGFGGPRV